MDAIETYTHKLREQARQEGRQEGTLDGRRATLRKQLILRFGELSQATEARVAAAGEDQLELWTERILTADSLQDVLQS